MIIDSSVILRWLIRGKRYEKECLKLREEFEKGSIAIKLPQVVVYDVCKMLAESDIPVDIASKLASLASEYLKYISVELDSSQLAEAVKVSRSLKVDFTVASCVVLANYVGEVYVTADMDLYTTLSSYGVRVSHVADIV
jgi:predicted nucleic acid-binding protein